MSKRELFFDCVRKFIADRRGVPIESIRESTPVGDDFSCVAERFCLAGCNPITTVGEISQLIPED